MHSQESVKKGSIWEGFPHSWTSLINFKQTCSRESHGRPKDAYVLKSGNDELMTLHNKGDFADMIKGKDSEMKRLASKCI